MTYNVQVTVMPLKELLDPQGKAVMGGLQNLGLNKVQDVRVGKTSLCRLRPIRPKKPKRLLKKHLKTTGQPGNGIL
ncbi:phosphoribosylformylglycinamidine synthase subunit PurS [Paraflavitalea speifideaquila]|uniref:phosphoribosylformylglycinamidine synthase subunit PurS n=1 Tax=Paraflavitalea speifideaquila TaxID=3076558 RepID=UPI0028E55E8B|nr:phosphoribosylformylglycinamidine synthase subunit PurS [Paraflavitalea speifideiaquila]